MREKIAVTRGEIAAIRMQLARMKENVAVAGKEKMEGNDRIEPMAGKENSEQVEGKEEMVGNEATEPTAGEETPATMPPPASETPMQPPAKILRLKSNRAIPEKVTISRVDTSDFKVVEGPTKTTKKPAQSGAYLSSFGSVLSALQSGNNHSYDEQSEPVVVSSTPVAVTVEMDPARGRQQRRRKVPQQAPSEPVAVMEKPRDMKDYHVPEDMNVAINKEALDEVVQELGSNQPAFMKRMIEELKGKWSVCCKQTQFLGDYVP